MVIYRLYNVYSFKKVQLKKKRQHILHILQQDELFLRN